MLRPCGPSLTRRYPNLPGLAPGGQPATGPGHATAATRTRGALRLVHPFALRHSGITRSTGSPLGYSLTPTSPYIYSPTQQLPQPTSSLTADCSSHYFCLTQILGRSNSPSVASSSTSSPSSVIARRRLRIFAVVLANSRHLACL